MPETAIQSEQDLTDFVARCLAPFAPEAVGKKPQVTCSDCSKKNCRTHVRAWCDECKQTITTEHIHIDFVGHAHLTDRLLQLDPMWSWEPFALDETGLPRIMGAEGMAHLWIRLTVNGITRIGVGSEPRQKFGKPNDNLMKELIGDALRNAAMRFGVALTLWAKGDLESEIDPEAADAPKAPAAAPKAAAKAAPAPRQGPAPARTGAPAKKAVAKKAATPPPQPRPAPAPVVGTLPDLVKIWRDVPKAYRQQLMADLGAAPIETDEGVVAMWPLPSRKTLGESGEVLSEETFAYVVDEAASTIALWLQAKAAEEAA